jgi:Domain of unknown function (DUF4328)
VVVLLVVVAVFQGLVALVNLGYIGLLEQFLDGEVTPGEVEDVQAGIGGLYLLSTLIQIVLAGFFIAWFQRAYRNLERASVAELRYSPGWAIGAWFIPIFNWIRPKQIANDVWRAGEGGVDVGDASWRSRPVALFLHWWWGIWIVSTVLFAVASVLSGASGEVIAGREEIDAEQTAATLDALAAILGLIAAVLAVRVVRRITARGESMRAAVLASGAQPPIPEAVVPAPADPGGRARCNVCGWVFGDREALQKHVAVHHPGR